jgi:peptidoglycan/xylan/chitin deacetylase (PgdA/CDA1 family)
VFRLGGTRVENRLRHGTRGQRKRTRLTAWGSALVLAAGLTAVAAPVAASAATQTAVSLTFDNGTISQYTLGYQQALQPHGAHASFLVNSGTVGASGNFISWAQLGTLAGAGNDIGGKTVSATNLTTDPNPTAQVCNDRTALLQHGLTPVAFAYPGGTQNSTVQNVVQSCGYGNGRTAGGLSPTGATYAETVPPANWFATRAYAPSAVTLANMESLVTGAASHGGGWDQIVIGKVCSQSLDPGNYSACSTSSGHIELSDLNSFLDWMANASQAGGAPAGATLGTVRSVVTSADSSAPVTTIACNGAPCTSTPYSGVVSVTLAATDTGSGVASTHYTTDGSDPTQSSPTYTGAFNVNGTNSTTTVKFRSWDYAGNAEAVNTQVIQAPADTTPPTTTIACNGAACASTPYVASVSVTLSATDAGGSGVDKTYYTTDGSTPTTSSTVYSGPFTLNTPATYNIQFFSTDKAGNAEQVQSRQINVVPVTTKISLTFDNGTVSQYALGYQQALQPHGAHATFFVNSGNIGVSANAMTWAQLGTLAGAGDDIGGKTVSATNLTTDPNPTSQVCDDRAALLQHGLTPVAFAYPGGAFNATVEGIVKGCGYGNARTAGSLSPAGPTYAETLPPKDWFATRAYAPTGQVTLANMEALVTGAAGHGGGWSQIVIGRVCSQAQDPASYASCTASAGWIELADLNSFLDWMGNAGQSGGAPAGSALSTVRDAAISADTSAPVTTIACNGSPCSSSVYTSTVYVTLPSTDVGSAVASTHYTTDGSTPTLSSPAYTGAFPLTSSATVQYRSWDNAGNVEAAKSQLVQVQQASDTTPPTTTISCNGAACASAAYTAPVTVTLTATDNPGGWGVDKTYYTTDGSTPTTSSPVYTGPFTVKQNTTVSFFSTDLAGNAEQPSTQAIQFKTVVSLTFDDGDASQYSVGFLHGMQPLGMHGTFYIVNGYTDVNSGTMTWSQLTNLASNGNDLGGHTVDHIDLTSSSYTQQQKTAEVCDNFQALTQHGLDPVSFAYPFGAYDTNAEQIVKSCGFSSARITGGIDRNGTGAGPVYAETIPPKDPYATRTVYNNGGSAPLTLSFLENSVTAAAQNGGGWAPLVFHEICSQTYDPANYSYCSSSWASIELDTFNAFLDWLQNAGQPGGAPAGTAVQTVRQVINGPDQTPPATTISCDGSPCQASTYNGSTTVALSAADKGGSGVKATYYTTDGSTPTTSSPVYTGAFTITQPTTVEFFSVDNAGNTEAVQTQQIQVVPNPDPVIGAAGDIACDPSQAAFNDGLGTATDCRALYTGKLLTGVDAVLPLGDVQYNCGGTAAFQQSYGPAWGPKLAITHPVPGGSDYKTSGGTDCPATAGAGYYSYFGSRAGDPAKGYYSYNLGQWHIVALNTGPCENGDASFCAAGSAQDQWLQNDLANNTASCTLAYYQNPRWASAASGSGGDSTYQQLWQDLYAGGADAALNGDSHWYERFAPLNASGAIDSRYGVREFIVGTGGQGLDTPGTEVPTSQVLNNTTHGVIKMTLHSGSYDWQFLNDGESGFTDSGSVPCHGRPDNTPPVTTISINGATPSAGWYNAPVNVTLAATDNQGGSGVSATYYTTDGSAPTTSSTKYAGPFTVSSASTVKFFSVDDAGNAESVQSQPVQIDTSPPSTAISCNGAACSSGWYNAAVKVTLPATDAGGSGVANTFYTTNGSDPTNSPTATLYTGAFTVPATATVKYYSTDNAGNAETVNSQQIQIDTTAPTTTISCNGAACSAGWYNGPVQVTLSASETGGPGVANTYYTTDGSAPTMSSTLYTGAFTVPATATVKFFSTDNAGNAEAVNSQQVQIDTSPPSTTISCNGAACSSGWYNGSVKVALPAADNSGGSGVNSTFYTTDGSDPATSPTATLYTGPFTVPATATVKYYSTDMAGNSEAVKSQLIQIDTAAPTTTISCNGGACSTGWYNAAVKVTLAATDNTGGSGVNKTYYTTDGSTPTTLSTVYTGAFTVPKTATVKFFSVDNVGNSGAVKSQLIQIDTTAPGTTITCNSAACSTGWYKTTPVTAGLSATDNTGGSGVKATLYTTDGSNPQTSNTAILYTGPFTISQTTTVKYYSFDNAGNNEPVKSQLIQIDAAAPTVSITAPVSGSSFAQGTKISLTATAADLGTGSAAPSGIASVTFYLDGTTVLATVTSSPYSFSWNTNKIAKGTHKLTAVAIDVAGNSTTSAAITISIT